MSQIGEAIRWTDEHYYSNSKAHWAIVKQYVILAGAAAASVSAFPSTRALITKMPPTVAKALEGYFGKETKIGRISSSMMLVAIGYEFATDAVGLQREWDRIFNQPWACGKEEFIFLNYYTAFSKLQDNDLEKWKTRIRVESALRIQALEGVRIKVSDLMRVVYMLDRYRQDSKSPTASATCAAAEVLIFDRLMSNLPDDVDPDKSITIFDVDELDYCALVLFQHELAIVNNIYLPEKNTPQVVIDAVEWWFITLFKRFKSGGIGTAAVLLEKFQRFMDAPSDYGSLIKMGKELAQLIHKLPLFIIKIEEVRK